MTFTRFFFPMTADNVVITSDNDPLLYVMFTSLDSGSNASANNIIRYDILAQPTDHRNIIYRHYWTKCDIISYRVAGEPDHDISVRIYQVFKENDKSVRYMLTK